MVELEGVSFRELSPIDRLTLTLGPVDRALKRLRHLVSERPFASPAEEILFFKSVKPKFYCWKVFAFERYWAEQSIPRGDAALQRAWLEGELAQVERFFHQHEFHYRYYLLGGSELDELYFLRGRQEGGSRLLPNVPEPDPEFSTGTDYLFAKFMAMEMMGDWLRERLGYLSDGRALSGMERQPAGELQWTGESINLAELAYGVFLTGQLNHGRASIGEVFRWLEEKLGVALGVPSKRMGEIRRRKAVSFTKFLDEMRKAIHGKLDDEDAIRTEKG